MLATAPTRSNKGGRLFMGRGHTPERVRPGPRVPNGMSLLL